MPLVSCFLPVDIGRESSHKLVWPVNNYNGRLSMDSLSAINLYAQLITLMVVFVRGSKKLIGKLPIDYLPDQLINWHCSLSAILIAIHRN